MDITILNWLKAKSRNLLTDNDLMVIAVERGIEDTEQTITELTTQQKELLYADCLVEVSSLPATFSEGESHDGFEKRRSYVMTNQDSNMKIAMSIYKKYGDSKYDELTVAKKSIKVVKIVENTINTQSQI